MSNQTIAKYSKHCGYLGNVISWSDLKNNFDEMVIIVGESQVCKGKS